MRPNANQEYITRTMGSWRSVQWLEYITRAMGSWRTAQWLASVLPMPNCEACSSSLTVNTDDPLG